MYIYSADLYCNDCGTILKNSLSDFKGLKDSVDSNDFPQYFNEANNESDSPTHCAMNEECVSAEIIIEPNFYIRKIGSQIDTILTSHGVDYIKEVISEKPKSGCAVLWESIYSDYL